jgi:hypothetical protein
MIRRVTHSPVARLFVLVFLVASVLFGAQSTLAATTWYVATNGSNGNDGSSAYPLATLQEAINRAAPGDTIIVRSGNYTVTGPTTIANKQGTSSAVLTIRGEGMPVFSTSTLYDIDVWQGILTIENSSWVRVEGIRLENSGWFSFKVDNSSNITLDGNQTYISLASAVYTYESNNITVTNNDVSRFCDQKERIRGSTCQEGMSLVKTNGFNVSYNLVHDAFQGDGMNPGGGEGIDAKEGSKNGIISFNTVYNLVQVGIYVDAWNVLTENIEIYGNKVYNVAHGISLGSEAGGTLRNVSVHDNLVYNIGYHGISIGSDEAVSGQRENIKIYNNTVTRSGFTAYKPPWCSLYGCGDWGSGILIDSSKVSGISIHDNISVNNHSAQLGVFYAASSAYSINTNILWPQTGYTWANETFGTNAIIADPVFVNASANDFHLQATSPAIGVGVGGDPLNVDADGQTRPSWPIDLGAFIYVGQGSGNTHGGSWAARLVPGTTYENLYQVASGVATNSNYTASVWLKGSGTIHLRVMAGTWGSEIGSNNSCTASGSWSLCTVTFNTGNNTTLTFRLTNPDGNESVYLDDAFLGTSGGSNTLNNSGFESGSSDWYYNSPFSIVQNP